MQFLQMLLSDKKFISPVFLHFSILSFYQLEKPNYRVEIVLAKLRLVVKEEKGRRKGGTRERERERKGGREEERE